MAELINRPQYLNQLIQNKDVDLVKIVTGIRRCGKSSLLDLFHHYLLENGVPDSRIVHMNMESLRYRDLNNYLSFYDYVSKQIAKDGKTYLIFDELQTVEHWEKAIESFRLDYDVDIYITGSNAYLLSTEFSTLLRVCPRCDNGRKVPEVSPVRRDADSERIQVQRSEKQSGTGRYLFDRGAA